MTFKTNIDIDVEVEADYVPASRGARDSLGGKPGAGPSLEPDEQAYAEITSVKVGNVELIDVLPDDLIEALAEEAMDYYTDDTP